MDELNYVIIELPNLEMSESFAEHDDRQWYFDDPPGPSLSGPGAERSAKKDATEEELAIYGFTQPLMKIFLTKQDEEVVSIEVGDAVPDGSAYYIRLADSNDIYIIDAIWYDVIERLVLEPPYAPEEED